MSRRNNGYTTVAQVKKNKVKGASGPKTKRKIFFTIGGKGDKLDTGIKVGCRQFSKRTRGLKAKIAA